MKILIIEDDPGLREMLAVTVAKRLEPKFELAKMEILAQITRFFVGSHSLLLAANLDDALRVIAEADAVLCDGRFPTSAGPISLQSGAPENWSRVAGAASDRQIPFAILSGDDALVTRAKLGGLSAFMKPFGTTAAVNHLFAEIQKAAAHSVDRSTRLQDQDKTAA